VVGGGAVRGRALALTLVVGPVLCAPAGAQVWEVGDRLVTVSIGASGFDRFGSEFAVGDFDGDGYDDLAIGSNAAEVVDVYRGGAAGLGGSPWVTLGPLAEWADFGRALAAGDLDDDGRDELIVGAPEYDLVDPSPIGAAGKVFVYELVYETWTNTASFTLASPGVPGDPAIGDRFGSSLAVGNFDGDDYDDVAIGVPDKIIVSSGGEGAVSVLYGSASGLGSAGAQLWHRAGGGIDGSVSYSFLGKTLAAGDFDSDDVDDLAIGAPYTSISGSFTTGEVVVLYGSAGVGLVGTGQQQIDPLDVGGTASHQYFGSSLAAGDFNASLACALGGSCAADLAIGAPGETVHWADTDVTNAGRVYVVRGSQSFGGLDPSTVGTIDQSTLDPLGLTAPEKDDGFGGVLLAVGYDRKIVADLLIATPSEEVGGVDYAGFVHVLSGGTWPLDDAEPQVLWARPGFASAPATYFDTFGGCLALGDFDDDGYPDLAVGIVNRSVDAKSSAGVVQILYGALFADGFERGSKSGWSVSVP